MQNACTTEILRIGEDHSADEMTPDVKIFDDPAVRKVVAANGLDTFPGVPNAPVFEWHSPTDELIPVESIVATNNRFCRAGVRISSLSTPAPNHLAAYPLGIPGALQWLGDDLPANRRRVPARRLPGATPSPPYRKSERPVDRRLSAVARLSLIAVVSVAAVVLTAAPATADDVALPTPLPDSFYDAPSEIGRYANGDVIASREMPDPPGLFALRTYQVKFRSTDMYSRPIAAVTTLLVPDGHKADGPLLSVQDIVNAMGLECSPSRQLYPRRLISIPAPAA